MISCLYYNLEATGYRVFAIRERADQRSGQGSCCSGWYWLSLRRKSGWPCATEISIIVSILLSLPHHTLEIINYGSQRGLEIPTKFHFCWPRKSIKLAKKWNSKYLRKLKLNCHTMSKVKFTQFFLQEISFITCYSTCPL